MSVHACVLAKQISCETDIDILCDNTNVELCTKIAVICSRLGNHILYQLCYCIHIALIIQFINFQKA